MIMPVRNGKIQVTQSCVRGVIILKSWPIDEEQATLTLLSDEARDVAAELIRLAAEVERLNADAFDRHLQHASDVVSTWPAWKQTVLGGTASAPKKCPNCERLAAEVERMRGGRRSSSDIGEQIERGSMGPEWENK